MQITLPYQEDSERVKQVLVDVAKDSPYVFPQAKRSLEKMMNFQVGIKHMNTKVTMEALPRADVPCSKNGEGHQDGSLPDLHVDPFPEMRNEIVSDCLQRSIEGLRAANVKLKDNSPLPAPQDPL